jgi:hypothetical protein
MERLIDLDECVVNALELFKKGLPELNLGSYTRPLVVGSGNAAVTGKILFESSDAVFADEGTYEKKIATIREIDGAALISASGGKHAPLIAKKLKNKKIETRLLTSNPNALAKEFVDPDKVFVFPTNPEPYTYNTSTYLSMILAKTEENPKSILDFIKSKVNSIIPKNLADYDAFYLIVPAEFDNAREMFMTKFDELFQPMVSGQVFTPEQTKHAKTVIPSPKQFFISFGYENKLFGNENQRLNIPLPKNSNYGAVVAIAYYVIGNIQKQHPHYFKDNIGDFVKRAAEIFGQEMKSWVKYG